MGATCFRCRWEDRACCETLLLFTLHAQVPAVPQTHVVDVTGCGNAFCGGFLAGLDSGLSLEQSGTWGCVAGSIMAEAQGVPTADVAKLLATARAKQQLLLQQMGLLCEQEPFAAVSSSGGNYTASSTAVQCLGYHTVASRVLQPAALAQHHWHCKNVPRLFSFHAVRQSAAKHRHFTASRSAKAPCPGLLKL